MVNGQLHIIEELQLFEEPQPVDSIVISEKQVRNKCLHSGSCKYIITTGCSHYKVHKPITSCLNLYGHNLILCTAHNVNLTTHLNLSLSDECVCGFAQLSGAVALVHMQQILLVLRLRDGT